MVVRLGTAREGKRRTPRLLARHLEHILMGRICRLRRRTRLLWDLLLSRRMHLHLGLHRRFRVMERRRLVCQ